MVHAFNRSISFPLSPNRSTKKCHAASYHVRALSLPCRSHPFISLLEEKIEAVRSWAARSDVSSSVGIETCLTHIEALQKGLEEFLHLTQAQEILRRAASTNCLLDDFLLLADVYGSFVSAVMSLKQHQSAVQSAVRRSDQISAVSALRSLRHVEKEIAQLASPLKNLSKWRPFGLTPDAVEAEITSILVEAIGATADASMAVFSGVAALSAPTLSTSSSSMTRLFRKLGSSGISAEFSVVEKLEKLEDCVGNVESCSERVFRRLINLRVSLLNISTPSL